MRKSFFYTFLIVFFVAGVVMGYQSLSRSGKIPENLFSFLPQSTTSPTTQTNTGNNPFLATFHTPSVGQPIEIKIKNTSGAATGDTFARFGIPLPREANVGSASSIRVTNASQTEVPEADVVALTRWGNSSAPLWWVGVVIPLNMSSGEERIYYLQYGTSRTPPSNPLTATDNGSTIVVNTGPAQFEIKKTGFNVFDKVTMGGTMVLANGSSNGIVAEQNGTEFTSKNDASSQVTIEEVGTGHAIVRAEGSLKSSNGATLLTYIMREQFTRGTTHVETSLTILNRGPLDRNANSSFHVRNVNDLRIELIPSFTGSLTAQLSEFYTTTISTEYLKAYQDATPSEKDWESPSASGTNSDPTPTNLVDNAVLKVLNEVTGQTLYNIGNLSEPQTGSRSNGLLAVGDGTRWVSMASRNYWQKRPKAVSVQGATNAMAMHLWPKDQSSNVLVHDRGPIIPCAGGQYQVTSNTGFTSNACTQDLGESNYIFHSGTSYTHEVFFRFGAGTMDQNANIQFAKAVQDPLIGLAPPPAYVVGFIDPLTFIPKLNWNDASLGLGATLPYLNDAAVRMSDWLESFWNENKVTQVLSGYAYPLMTYWNRIKSGTEGAGASGRTSFGPAYYGNYRWAGDGYGNTAYGEQKVPILDALHGRNHEAITRSWGIFEAFSSGQTLYRPRLNNNFSDYGAGYAHYEKGGVYGGGPSEFEPGSWRHKRVEGSAIAALVAANLDWKETLVESGAVIAGGYPFTSCCITPGSALTATPGGVRYDGPAKLGVEAGTNLIHAYAQVTGDATYITKAIALMNEIRIVAESCEQSAGFPFIPQIMSPQSNCLFPESNGQYTFTQPFTDAYYIRGMTMALAAQKAILGTEDAALKSYVLRAIDFAYTYYLRKTPQSANATASAYYPISYYHTIYLRRPGFNPPQSSWPSVYNQCHPGAMVPEASITLSTGVIMDFCEPEDASGTLVWWVHPFAWAYEATGNNEYLNTALTIFRDNGLYLGAPVPPFTLGNASQYAVKAWRHTFGVADIKLLAPMVTEMWPALVALLEGSTSPPPPPSPPAAPSNLNATAGTAGVTLTWADGSTNETGFLIERRTGTTGTFSEIATVNAGVTSYLDAGVSVGVTYGYRVRASNSVGQSAYTTIFSITVPDITPPTISITAPTGGATLTGTVTITASASDNIGVVGIQFLVDGAPFGTEDLTAPFSTSWNTVNTENGAHVVSARARDAENNIAVAPAVNVTTSNQGKPTFNGPTSTLTAPLSGATVSGTISITATAIQGTSRIANAQFLLDGNNLNALIVGPSPFTTTWNTTSVTNGLHTLGVRVTDGLGNAGLALPMSVTVNNPTISPPTPPPPPGGGGTGGGFSGFTAPGTGGTGSTGFTAPGGAAVLPAPGELRAARATPARIRLTWVDTNTLEQSHFIERSETGATSGFVEIGIIGANRTSFDDSPILGNKSYWYRVKVSNIIHGPSAYSNIAAIPALTETTVPSTPTDFSIALTSSTYPSGLRFVWNDPSAIETRIELHFSTDGNAFRKVNEFANLTHFTYGGAGLSSATRYYYALKACKDTVCSPFSNTATVLMPTASTPGATLPPPTPTPTPPPQFTAPPGPSPSATFTRTLKMGDAGADVRSLQKCLNRNGSPVATSGTGSLGNETTHYGSLTRYAVFHFQEAHRAQVLTPVGLTTGTGIFGPATRAYMNTLGCTP